MDAKAQRLLTASFEKFKSVMKVDVNLVASRHITLNMPYIEPDEIVTLCTAIKDIITDDATIVFVNSPCIIIGDLHGHFLDLVRIIQRFGYPDDRRFIFLGDMVDRGEFSLETCYFIFLLKYFYPDNVQIIRGNHEFSKLCSQFGFAIELQSHNADPRLFAAFNSVFNELPLVCIIDEQFFCVHGGIGPGTTLEAIGNIQKPITSCDSQLVTNLLWSDPDPNIEHHTHSPRGSGVLFGESLLRQFLEENGLLAMIRAHEYCPEGTNSLFGGLVTTVFSASHYCGTQNNKGAVIELNSVDSMNAVTFDPLPYTKRCFASFAKPAPFHAKSTSTPLIPRLASQKTARPLSRPGPKTIAPITPPHPQFVGKNVPPATQKTGGIRLAMSEVKLPKFIARGKNSTPPPPPPPTNIIKNAGPITTRFHF